MSCAAASAASSSSTRRLTMGRCACSRGRPAALRAPERADRVGRWAQGHPKPGQIRGQRPASSRMEPGAAGLSGRDEAFGAESSFQALRGHGRGHVGMENTQTPPFSRKTPGRFPCSRLRISLSWLWVAESGRADWGCTGSWGRGRERPPLCVTFCVTGEGAVFHGDFHVTRPPGGVAPC